MRQEVVSRPGPVPGDEPAAWPVRHTEDVWRGNAPFAVRLDTVSPPGDSETSFTRLVVEHPGAVAVLAVDEEERAFVLRQYRHPAQRRFVELPAGLLDVPGEDPLVAARRELLEEAALEADDWVHLGSIHTSPGITAEGITMYLARGLRHVPDRGGFEPTHEEADMTAHWVAVDELVEAIAEKRLRNGPLVTAVLTYVLLHRPREGRM